MRLHVQLGRVDVAELDLLDPQLLAQLLRVALGERRALDDEAPQRLAELQLGGRAGLMAEPDDAPQLGDLVQERLIGRAGLGPARQVHRLRRLPPAPRTRLCQRCSARNGITGATTRIPCTSACQSAWSASASPSQKRRRERRMYQLETSSTNSSKARVTFTVRKAS